MSIMFQSDLSNVRELRQDSTNENLAEFLAHTESFTDKDLKKFVNFKALDRLCKRLGETRDEVYQSCKGNYREAMMVANNIAILSSRQGSKDEHHVLNEINKVTSPNGINVTPLNNQDLRPLIDSPKLLTKEEYQLLQENGLGKYECLKSIDGEISGKVNGYIFAKIVFGEGGHQDNVFHEAASFGNWAQQYGESDKIYVILIDTDLDKKYNELKQRFDNGNVWVVDHVEFQQRLGIN